MLLDTAFSRASKLTLPKSKRATHIRAREREIAKLKLVQEVLCSRLEDIVKRFPSFDQIHPFYSTLAETVVSVDKVRQDLASVSTSIRIIKGIIQDSRRKLSKAQTTIEARKLRRAAYGRISSVLRRLDPRLETIQHAAKEYRRFPSIRLDLPVVVVAGFPNVGKSSFVAHISSAQPEVAEYPFTTKGISVGHFSLDPLGGQILDLPGLLDRPMSKRNPVEQRAIAAIQYLADCIIFLIDPTWACGYELTSQFGLLHEIQNTFPSIEVFPLLNKNDIANKEEVARATQLLGVESVPLISTLTGDGVEPAFQTIIDQSETIQAKQKTLQEQHLQP